MNKSSEPKTTEDRLHKILDATINALSGKQIKRILMRPPLGILVDFQLVNRLKQDAETMAKHLVECFVSLCGHALASQAVTMLRLDH